MPKFIPRTTTIADAGKQFGIGRNRTIRVLVENGWMVATEHGYMPRQAHVLQGRLIEYQSSYLRNGVKHPSVSTRITRLGMTELEHLLRKLGYELEHDTEQDQRRNATSPHEVDQPAIRRH